MPLLLPAGDAATLAAFLRDARQKLAGSPAAAAIARGAEPPETRAMLARLADELSAPARPDGRVELRVVDDDGFYAASRHLRGIMAWITALVDGGELALEGTERPTRVVDQIADYTERLHRMRDAFRRGQGS